MPSPGLLEDFADIANETLGFEKVFVVGLKERSDKRDALALSSALTGFKLEWVDGVRGETIPNKAVPAGVDRKALWETNLGSWRGHMNAVRGYLTLPPGVLCKNSEDNLLLIYRAGWSNKVSPLL